MKERKISGAVIRRLPHYLRVLTAMAEEGTERISSGELSERIGYTASQIRQDLNHFGGFGQQGYGYNVKDLKDEIEKILGLNNKHSMIFIGCGRLGQAVANFVITSQPSYEVKAIFDIREDLVGTKFQGVEILHESTLKDYLKEHNIDIAVLTVPTELAQRVADDLACGGVLGLWNFAATDLKIPDSIQVNNVHLSDNLHALTYYINHSE